MGLLDFFKKIEPDKKNSPFLHTLYDGFFTFLYAPKTVTKGGVHIRDGMDLKRTMVHVVLALQLCYIFASWNIGQQHFNALGIYGGWSEAFNLKIWHGLITILPIFLVSNVVGLGVEFWFAAKKGHPIEEGYLVSGALIPLIMPPDIPLWILTLAIIFAVIIGKEAFGGTGMNVLNIALLARVFIFFAYPTTISGDEVWVGGLAETVVKEGTTYLQEGSAIIATSVIETKAASYGFLHSIGNWIFDLLGWTKFQTADTLLMVDGFSGATPLSVAAASGWEATLEKYPASSMWAGSIPGSIGESCKPLIILGALFLVYIRIASWRVMLSMVIGAALTGMLFNAWGATPFMTVPWHGHFLMGSFLFAMAFMATDPVTAASTNTGKWIYGFFIGSIGLIIRVMNPAYPEGWMLAILFMNVFAPLIDHYVIEANISKRLNRVRAK